MFVIALLLKVCVGTIAKGKHTAATGFPGVGANMNLSRNAFECITRHTCIAKIGTLIRYLFNWPWVKENEGKKRVRLNQWVNGSFIPLSLPPSPSSNPDLLMGGSLALYYFFHITVLLPFNRISSVEQIRKKNQFLI